MINHEKIIDVIFRAIDEVNLQLPREGRLEKSKDASLFGNSGKLDSLGLISFVTAIEQNIEEDLGMPIPVLEEIEALEDENPFETVTALADYLTVLLERKAHE